jgi:O-methyltransferase involved in polyketide biosynthesis
MVGSDLRQNWLAEIPAGGTAIVVMEGISMYLTAEERQALLRALGNHFDRVQLLLDAYTVFAARATRYKNPINDVGVTTVYGFDDPREPEQGTGFAFVREHDMTPEAMITGLPGSEQGVFRLFFAGKTAKKFYRMYEYKK